MIERAIAEINCQSLVHNLKVVRSQIPSATKVLSMIKASGYGHGALRVAKALPMSDAFGVACIKEAMWLRQNGINQPIVLMSGFTTEEELALAIRHNLDLVIHQAFQIEYLKNNAAARHCRLWLKIDTGMHRLGILPEQVDAALVQLKNFNIILMTHFANADSVHQEDTQRQIDLFYKIVKSKANYPASLANSAAIYHFQQSHANWVRPGIMLYGVSPFVEQTGAELGLQPVMTLRAKLIAINQLRKGDAIGYGSIWQCPEAMPVGVVAIGYGDGYPRHIDQGAPVLLHGVECPVVGRVSMDLMTIDLRRCKQAKVGDWVTLWGKGLPIEIIARHANTIGYELLCQVTDRVEKKYFNE